MNQHKTPLRYPGGKQKLAPFIAEILAANGLEGGHYAETYAGGAGVAIELLLSGAVAHIHLNDSSVPLHAFWRSVVYRTEEFCRRVSKVPLSVAEWRRQKEVLARPWEFDQIDLGFSMFYLNRCNRSGIDNGGLIGGLKQNGKWRMDARFPRKELIRRMEAIGAKHGAITLRNWDAERFIIQHLPTLPPRSLVYCDPPYFHKAERLYHNHYAPEDHERIAGIIQARVNLPWLISYDHTPEVLAFYSGRRMFSYDLQYNAARAYKGKELIVFEDRLRLPSRSVLPFIDRELKFPRAAFLASPT
jgi:DNA adenine methylase